MPGYRLNKEDATAVVHYLRTLSPAGKTLHREVVPIRTFPFPIWPFPAQRVCNRDAFSGKVIGFHA